MKSYSLILVILSVFLLVGLASANTYPVNKVIQWEGLNWVVTEGDAMGSHLNNWSASGNNLWVDDAGSMHMTIKNDGGEWHCTELRCENDYTYGKFTWRISANSPIFSHDRNVILGLFTYKDDLNETDIEISRWKLEQNNLALFTVQPYDIPGNSVGFLPSVTANGVTTTQAGYDGRGITFSMNRQPTYVEWFAIDDNGTTIAHHNFTNPALIPSSPEKLMMNLWLRDPPTNGQDVEVIIDSLDIEATPVTTTPYNGAISYTAGTNYIISNISNLTPNDRIVATITPTTQTLDPYAKFNTTGLVGWWKLDDQSVLWQYVNDSSGNRNYGIAQFYPTHASGKYNDGMYFDGAKNIVDMPSTLALNNTMTYACWFNTNNITKTQQTFLAQYVSAASANYQLYLKGANPALKCGNGASVTYGYFLPTEVAYAANITVAKNTLSFIAYTISGSTVKIYFNNGNGWKVASGYMDFALHNQSGAQFELGGIESYYPYTMWSGMLDNVMLWNRALPQSEIYAMYNDTPVGLRAKTNVNNTYGNMENIPFGINDGTVSGLTLKQANVSSVNGITIYDVWNTTTPFTLYASLGSQLDNRVSELMPNQITDVSTTSNNIIISRSSTSSAIQNTITSGYALATLMVLALAAGALMRLLGYM